VSRSDTRRSGCEAGTTFLLTQTRRDDSPCSSSLFARTDSSSSLPMPKTVATKPYDWTYTTTYIGHQETPSEDSASSHLSWGPSDPEEPSNAIPMAELSRPDPILFYAEIPLFEDELHDNGSSSLLVRIVRESIFHIHKRPYP